MYFLFKPTRKRIGSNLGVYEVSMQIACSLPELVTSAAHSVTACITPLHQPGGLGARQSRSYAASLVRDRNVYTILSLEIVLLKIFLI